MNRFSSPGIGYRLQCPRAQTRSLVRFAGGGAAPSPGSTRTAAASGCPAAVVCTGAKQAGCREGR